MNRQEDFEIPAKELSRELQNRIFFTYYEVNIISKYCKVTGLSYSATVLAIVEGLVEYEKVGKIVAGTGIETEEDLTKWIEDNKTIEWRENPSQAEEIARKFWKEGKVEQSKLSCPARIPMLYGGIWIIFGNEDKIIYSEIN